jgi:ABC-2 type transport system ATP-binding protein
MAVLIETQELSKYFNDFQAVDSVTIDVKAGEVLALLGPNGAGKTTTIRMLASILKPTRGWARIAGYDVVRNPRDVRSSIGMLTEHHGLYTRMQAEEYLAFFGRTYGLTHDRIRKQLDSLLDQLDLQDYRWRRLGEFSKGMRQKLALARALLHDPPILLLDEPTSAMDPASARLVRESILRLRSSSRALIVCSHNLNEAEALSDRIAIIRKGKIVAMGSSEDLKRRFLGNPVMKIVLSESLNGLRPALPAGVSSIEYGANWIQYAVAKPKEVNPQVLHDLAEAGYRVVTLSEVGRSLEDVYMNAVQGHIED